jgi:bifunctional UDP-N-acetylglucosamine pyrophosphorylase/glucosamine-1-phosphate N-acetyltransferase
VHPEVAVVILAAGKGTRMRSQLPKVLHEIAGETLLGHVLATVERMAIPRAIAIVGHGADQVRATLPDWVASVTQQEQLGTGHAVQQVVPVLADFQGDVLILSGDVPLLSAETLAAMQQAHREAGATLTLLTTELADPTGYGRIVRAGGAVKGIVEHKDASPDQRAIREINAGVYLADWTKLRGAIATLSNSNAQGEYYLTDAVASLVNQGEIVVGYVTPDATEVSGINTRAELVALAAEYQRRSANAWLAAGVTVESPATTWIGPRVTIGEDTVIEQGVALYGRTVIGRECRVGAFSRLRDTELAARVEIRHSDLEDSTVDEGTTIGPFARLRGHAALGRNCRIGNFVEVKGSCFGDGAKAAHLAYLGDATIGSKANIGAGTITCNYDGTHKHATTIGEGAFIGSNSTLVAPLAIGDHAFTAAGSTIVSDVPEGALALGRARQTVKEGWVLQRKGITR